jgi:hypothetical protein
MNDYMQEAENTNKVPFPSQINKRRLVPGNTCEPQLGYLFRVKNQNDGF